MNTIATPAIRHTDVTNTYAGAEGCACGCNGIYSKTGATLTRRVNTVNLAIANGEYVATYAYSDEVVYEYTKPNGRIIRIYVDKTAYVAN